jgi:hypothetical protein
VLNVKVVLYYVSLQCCISLVVVCVCSAHRFCAYVLQSVAFYVIAVLLLSYVIAKLCQSSVVFSQCSPFLCLGPPLCCLLCHYTLTLSARRSQGRNSEQVNGSQRSKHLCLLRSNGCHRHIGELMYERCCCHFLPASTWRACGDVNICIAGRDTFASKAAHQHHAVLVCWCNRPLLQTELAACLFLLRTHGVQHT